MTFESGCSIALHMKSVLSFILLLVTFPAVAIPLYEVRWQGKTSYILGTVHTIADASQLPAELKNKIHRARVVYVEDDPKRVSSKEKMADGLEADFQDGLRLKRSLKGFLGTPEWLKLKRVLTDAAFNPNFFLVLSPRWAWKVADRAFDENVEKIFHQVLEKKIKENPELAPELLGFLDSSHYKPGSKLIDWLIADVANSSGVPVRLLDQDVYDDEGDREPQLSNMTVPTLKTYVRARLKQLRILENNRSKTEIDFINDLLAKGSPFKRFLDWTPENYGVNISATVGYKEFLPELIPLHMFTATRHSMWLDTILREIKRGDVFVAAGIFHIAREGNMYPFISSTVLEELARAGMDVRFIGFTSCAEAIL